MQHEIISVVLVFKTNIRDESDWRRIASILDRVPGITKWNVDRMDIDNVLRIETDKLHPDDVCNLVRQAGFWCEELED